MLAPKDKIMRFSNVAWIENLTSLNHISLEPANKRHEASLKDNICFSSTTGEINNNRTLSGKTFTFISTPLEPKENFHLSTQLLKPPTRLKITPSQHQSMSYSSKISPFETEESIPQPPVSDPSASLSFTPPPPSHSSHDSSLLSPSGSTITLSPSAASI